METEPIIEKSSKLLKTFNYSSIVNIVTFGAILAFVASVAYLLYHIKKEYIDNPRYELIEVRTPMNIMNEGIQENDFSIESLFGRGINSRNPINIARPYDPRNPQDNYGVFNIDRSNSATLTVSTPGGYHEVVVYKYPTWELAYAETNITEVSFDFLEHGNYIVHVFSPSTEIRGSLEVTRNTGKQRPEERSHRITSSQVAEARDDAIASCVASLAPNGTKEIMRVGSSETLMWPTPVYSKIETLYSRIPEDAVAVFVAVPSYGYVLEGAEEHLGQIVHEGHNAAIYRAASQPPALSGGRIIDHEDNSVNKRVISVTILYPDISKDSPAKTSPSSTLFVYAQSIDN